MSDVRQIAKVSNAGSPRSRSNEFRTSPFSGRLMILGLAAATAIGSLFSFSARAENGKGKNKPAATAPKDATPKPKTDDGKPVLVAQAGSAKAPLAQVAAGQTAQTEEVTFLTQADLMKAIRMARGYGIRVPDICRTVNESLKDYAVVHGRRGEYTMVIAEGGGFAVYKGMRNINARNSAELPDDSDTVSLSFATGECFQNPSKAGFRRAIYLDIPYKTPQGEDRSLIVDATPTQMGLYTQNETGKWDQIGLLQFGSVLFNAPTSNGSRPVVLVRDFTDEDGTYKIISILDPRTKQGREVYFATDDGKVYGMGQNFTGMPLIVQ